MINKKNDVCSEIGLFILYAFGIPTICICIMNCIEEYDKGGLFTLILYGIEGASPALAAIFVKLQKQGVNGVKTFLVNKYKYSLSARLCVIGFCIPCIMITIGKMLTYLTPYNNQFIYSLSLKKIIIVMWALVAEELGWRGYLQEKIEAHVGDVLTPLIVGIIWTVWHFHFLYQVLWKYRCIHLHMVVLQKVMDILSLQKYLREILFQLRYGIFQAICLQIYIDLILIGMREEWNHT